MAEQKTTPQLATFYMQQCHERATGTLKNVCQANEIPLEPKSPAQLRAIPVFEEDSPASLLSVTNGRIRTTVTWTSFAESNHLQAYVKRYRDADTGHRYNEIVVNTQNYCWARFYVAKELMHCVTNEDGYPATDTIELVNDLIESLISGGFMDHKPQTVVDQVAWLGACEYLLPESWMPMILRVHTAIATEFPDADADLHMAQILRVPVLILRYRMKHFKQAE